MLAEEPDVIRNLKQEAAVITKAKKGTGTPITLQQHAEKEKIAYAPLQ